MMNAPVVVWQRGSLRVVALDGQDKEERPMLVLERRYLDALDQESWRHIVVDEESGTVLDALITEIASKIDMLPKWVREFVHSDLADLESGCTCGEHEGGS